ncbi:hypothetical protein AKJ16_DCAP10581, partial [Drosera capensis]
MKIDLGKKLELAHQIVIIGLNSYDFDMSSCEREHDRDSIHLDKDLSFSGAFYEMNDNPQLSENFHRGSHVGDEYAAAILGRYFAGHDQAFDVHITKALVLGNTSQARGKERETRPAARQSFKSVYPIMECGRLICSRMFIIILLPKPRQKKLANFGCAHEKIAKIGIVTRFKVGLYKVDRSLWRVVDYDLMKVAATLPERYILKRWAINARFKFGEHGGCQSTGTEGTYRRLQPRGGHLYHN